ncbi:TlpA family protein disulfide reductase [Spirosoma fluviale]|uniref:Thioredoxin domain-containing protein n=1 Tax=Spirosoma fluviale TaxID=1597977 RepID=A0A286FBR4_9BACT|nr:hypothetical protein [Spirosoma fluviale]SOD80439.1 hypothetical protein SAMN06269250_1403 [Spirosoma fluviale]
MKNSTLYFLSTFILLGSQLSWGQIITQQTGIRHTVRIDDTIPITNAETGKPATLKEFKELTSVDPYGYHLIPDYNESGQPKAYTIRKATVEEREIRGFRDRDPNKQPKVGKPIAPFVMTGMDKKVYRSVDLVGNVIVLSFLVNLNRPFWGDKDAAKLTDALRPYQSENGPIVLGVMADEAEVPNGSTLPFMPILNGHGFHGKYHITSIPTIIVIDKKGNVAASLEGGSAFDELKQVLSTVSR